MFSITSIKKSISQLTILTVAGLLTSCGTDKVDHATYIPSNACAVISINTDQIFSDAMFDLLSNTDMTEGITKGPFAKFAKDPGSAGLVRLDRYYFYGVGTNVMDTRLGAVLPVSDAEKLKEYVSGTLEVEVTQDSIYNVAELSNTNAIVWDDNAAILVYSPIGGNLISDAIGYFSQNETTALSKSETTFDEALKDQSHIVGWFKNDELLNNIEGATAHLQVLKKLNINKDNAKDSKSIFSFNFLDGKITLESKQYLNDKQLQLYKDLGKPNSIAPLLASAGSENPVAMVSTSLKTEGLLAVLKEYKLDQAFDDMLKRSNAPVKPKLDYVINFFKGDALILVNDFTEIKKNKVVTELNDEGNYEQKVVEITEKIPAVTIGMPLKNEGQLKMMLPYVVKDLPVEDGVYNYNNEAYITIQNGVLFVANSPKGVESIKGMTGKLNPRLTTLASTHRVASYLDLKRTFEFTGEGMPMVAKICETGASYLQDLVITEKGINENGAVVNTTEINFVSKENSLITTVKFSDDMSKAVKPVLNMLF